MMTIRQTVEIDFSESNLLDMCKKLGFPDVRLHYDLSIMCDYTKITLRLGKNYTKDEIEKELDNRSGNIWLLMFGIKKLAGVQKVERTTYTNECTGYEGIELIVQLVGILYHEKGRMLS